MSFLLLTVFVFHPRRVCCTHVFPFVTSAVYCTVSDERARACGKHSRPLLLVATLGGVTSRKPTVSATGRSSAVACWEAAGMGRLLVIALIVAQAANPASLHQEEVVVC